MEGKNWTDRSDKSDGSDFFLFGAVAAIDSGHYIIAVVGDEKSCQRKGYYKPYEAEKSAPDREGQKNYCGIESHGLAHYAGSQEKVLDALDDGIDSHTLPEKRPELPSPSDGIDQTEESRRDDGDDLKIWHEVEKADEKTENDGHWESDEGESEGEKDADDQGDERLSAEITVHGMLDVADNAARDGLHPFRYEGEESTPEPVVVKHDEDHVENNNEPADNTEHHCPASGDDFPRGTEGIGGYLHPVEVGKDAVDPVGIDILPEKMLEVGRKEADSHLGGSIAGQDSAHLPDFVENDGGNEPCGGSGEKESLEEGHENSGRTPLQPEKTAVELDERLEKIGYDTGDEKGEQDIAQDIGYPDKSEDDGKRLGSLLYRI